MLLVSLAGCVPEAESSLERFSNTAIDVGFNDAPVTFIAYTKDEAEFNQYFTLLRQDLTVLGRLYDRYNNYDQLTNLKTVNALAGQGALKVDPALFDLFKVSYAWYTLSQQTFDITLGAVLNVWHNYRSEGRELNAQTPAQGGRVPTLDELQNAHQCTGWDQVLLDDNIQSIEILNPCTQLDVGGIAKGFAVDRVLNNLINQGLERAIVNLGDSSIVTLGEKPDGSEWGIGIAQPKRPVQYSDNSVDTLYFKGSIAISTSGDNQNYYFAQDGQYYAHIIDPNTLYPVVSSLHSVTVATSLGATGAEALSKALYILDYDEAIAYLSSIQALYPDDFIGAVWVYTLDQAPIGSNAITSEGFSVVHSDNLKAHSRLYR